MSLSLARRHQTLYIHYQKWSQQYTEEKSKFLRCEDLRIFWDLKVGLSPSKKTSIYLLQWKPFKNDEKCFLILKALFVLKIFKVLS